MYLSLAAKQAVIFDGKTMHLILDSRNQFKSLAGMADWDLMILIIQSSRPVIVVLNHTTDGNRQPQIRKDVYKRQPDPFPGGKCKAPQKGTDQYARSGVYYQSAV